MKVKNIELILFVFAVVIIVLVIYNSIQPPVEEDIAPETVECAEGSVRDCERGPCNGTQSCTNGTWEKCSVEIICTPGARTPCVMDHCASAYKICNECGTGYGECIG